MQYDFHDLKLIPLTPIHVGGGPDELLGIEDYRLKVNSLERVDVYKHILKAGDCEQIIRDINRDLTSTLSRIKDRISDQEIIERIAISKMAYDKLDPIFSSPQKNAEGKIHAFQRSGGYPILPGSSLKGCLRTAWLAECVRNKPPNTISNYKNLESSAFQLDSINDTGTDPFKDIVVNDITLPDKATQVDMISSWKYIESEDSYGSFNNVQIFRERLKSVIDGGIPPVLTVRLGICSKQVHSLRNELEIRRKIKGKLQPKIFPRTIYDLLSALKKHHEPLWEWEIKKFFPNDDGKKLKQALALFDKIRSETEKSASALLRIGWASHGEVKSVARYLKSEHLVPKQKTPEGKTRQVIELPCGSPAPFGWALLVLKNEWNAKKIDNWLPMEKGNLKKGERVVLEDGSEGVLQETIFDNQIEVRIDLDGDIEVINTSEIVGLASDK